MNFKEQYLLGVKTPILLPDDFKLLSIQNGKIIYKNSESNECKNDEPLFLHDESKIILNQFRSNFPNDSVIIILFNSKNNIYLHRRAASKKWEPNKIDLASVAGQRRALFINGNFKNETISETALREISEETNINLNELSSFNLHKIGVHYNPHTDEYQTIFTYKLDISVKELNNKLKQTFSNEVAEWFEFNYLQTMNEYFGNEVNKYAGGEKMRPVNFISVPEIKKKLDLFFNK